MPPPDTTPSRRAPTENRNSGIDAVAGGAAMLGVSAPSRQQLPPPSYRQSMRILPTASPDLHRLNNSWPAWGAGSRLQSGVQTSKQFPHWKFRLSLSPWFTVLYPLGTIQTRSVCMSHLLPVGSIIPNWVPWDAVASGRIAKKRPLLAACATDPFSLSSNIVTGTYNALSLVYRVEGVWGLYRGVLTSVTHGILRDVLTYGLLRWTYHPLRYGLEFVGREVRAIVYFTRRLLSNWRSRLCLKGGADEDETNPEIVLTHPSGTRPTNNSNISQQGQSGSIQVSPTSSNFVTVYSSAEAKRQRLEANPFRTRYLSSPVLDLPQAVVKAAVEIVIYPLLTLATRQVIYEGPDIPTFSDLLYLTRSYDGTQGLYKGFTAHILVRLLDDLVDVGCVTAGLRCNLRWTEMMTIRAGLSAVLGTFTAPLSSLSLIQRAQSTMPGLCDSRPTAKEILSGMAWRLLALNFGLTIILATFNAAAFFASDRSDQTDYTADELRSAGWYTATRDDTTEAFGLSDIQRGEAIRDLTNVAREDLAEMTLS